MDSFTKEFEHLKIPLEEIKKVTNDFSNEPIGSGGFGKVYQGELSHSKGRSLVAIKRLDRKFGQGDPEFWREIIMLSRYSHENLISLLGFCDEAGEKIIVYELASNGSLDGYLSSPDLTWEQRIKICLGAAEGLRYLHEDKGTHQRVIHRDIKSSNILLDSEWNAKVSDMGLSKLGPANQEYTALVTNVVGTLGYLDPVYLQKGVLTKESDVYSFGVVLFEVLCGRPCFISNGNGNLVQTWKQSYRNKKIHENIVQNLTKTMEMYSMETFSDIAFQCVQESHENRPTMSHVVERLRLALLIKQRHELKLPEEYVNILKAVETPLNLRYNSLEELKLLLSNGVFLDAGNTWFSINDKGEHSVLIFIRECLIREAEKSYEYTSQLKSRFVRAYHLDRGNFRTRVRTQYLSPNITYAVNLVCKFQGGNSESVNMKWKHFVKLKYKLDGETKTWTSYLAHKSKDDGWYRIVLYQFASDGTPVDLDIIFEENDKFLAVEGIEFQPTENVEEHQVSDDEMQVDDTSYYDIDLGIDILGIIVQSKDIVEGFLINSGSVFKRLFNNGQQWFYSLDKNGKKCLMLSARAAFKAKNITKTNWDQSDDSRFGEVLTIKKIEGALFQSKINYQGLSLRTKYACYLVYKVPDKDPDFEIPVSVSWNYNVSDSGHTKRTWYIYLVSPLTPVIKPKVGENTRTPLIRRKKKGFPQQRSDDWMEVQVYEFQTTDTTEGVIPSLRLERCGGDQSLRGLIIQGVAFRPI